MAILLWNFGRRYYEEQFCEIILNLDQWFRRRCRLKIFLIWSSGGPFVQPSRTICKISVKDIMRNNSVKLFWIWTSGSGGNVIQKDISYLELWQPLCSVERNHLCNFSTGYQEEHFLELFEFGPVFQEEMGFEDISYLELWQPLSSAGWNHLCNFCRWHHEEQFSEIILNLDQWFRRKSCLKIFLIWSSGSPFVQRSGTICAILVEGIMSNNSVKLLWIWISGLGGDAF